MWHSVARIVVKSGTHTSIDNLSTEKAPCISAAEPAENAKKPQPGSISRDSRLNWRSRVCLVMK